MFVINTGVSINGTINTFEVSNESKLIAAIEEWKSSNSTKTIFEININADINLSKTIDIIGGKKSALVINGNNHTFTSWGNSIYNTLFVKNSNSVIPVDNEKIYPSSNLHKVVIQNYIEGDYIKLPKEGAVTDYSFITMFYNYLGCTQPIHHYDNEYVYVELNKLFNIENLGTSEIHYSICNRDTYTETSGYLYPQLETYFNIDEAACVTFNKCKFAYSKLPILNKWGQCSNYNHGGVIKITSGISIWVEECEFYNIGSNGIYGEFTDLLKIDKCTFTNIGCNGVALPTSDSRCTISNNIFTVCGFAGVGCGIMSDYPISIEVTKNQVQYCSWGGISITSWPGTSFRAEPFGYKHMPNAEQVIISFNTVRHCNNLLTLDAPGIYVRGNGVKKTIIGNIVYDINSIDGSSQGIYCDDGCTNTAIFNNQIYDSNTLIRSHHSSGCICAYNVLAFPNNRVYMSTYKQASGILAYRNLVFSSGKSYIDGVMPNFQDISCDSYLLKCEANDMLDVNIFESPNTGNFQLNHNFTSNNAYVKTKNGLQVSVSRGGKLSDGAYKKGNNTSFPMSYIYEAEKPEEVLITDLVCSSPSSYLHTEARRKISLFGSNSYLENLTM